MKAGDKNRMFIARSRHPKKQSLKCWERTTLPAFDEKWKERPVPSRGWGWKYRKLPLWAEGFVNRQPQLASWLCCSASKIKKGLSNKSLIPLPHSGKFAHVPVNMLCFLSSGFLSELPQWQEDSTRRRFSSWRRFVAFPASSLAGDVNVLLRAVEFALYGPALQRASVLNSTRATQTSFPDLITHPAEQIRHRISSCSVFCSCVSTFCKSKTIMKPFRNNHA